MKKIDKILCLDIETSGLNKSSEDITKNHQIVSIGLIVSDGDFNEIDNLYLEIKWNGKSRLDYNAEKVHGLSREYLEKYGISEEDAVVNIAEFIFKYFGTENSIYILGHNAYKFDVPFLRKLLKKYDLDHFKFGSRYIDTFSIGFTLFGKQNSDEIFSLFYKKREKHNSLEDARMALGVCRKVRKMIKNIL